jgi:MFS family permease
MRSGRLAKSEICGRPCTDVAHYGAMADRAGTSPYTLRNILTIDYVLGFLAFFSFLAAFHALIPTLPLYLARLGSSEREIGVLVGAFGVASLASRLLVGRVLLKFSERLVMMGGATLFIICFLSLILFSPFWPFLIVRVLQGVAFACLDTAAIAYVIRISPPAYRARAINYFLLAPSLAAAISATSGVVLVNTYGFSALLLSCAGLSICAALLSSKLNVGASKPAAVSPAKHLPFFEPKILAPAMANFLVFFCWAGVAAFFPLYAVQCGVTNPGYFFSAAAVMLIAIRALGGKAFEVFNKEKIIATFIAVSAVTLVMLAFSRTLPLFIIVGLFWGMSAAFLFPIMLTWALEYAGSSDGSALGTYQASMDLGLALGPVGVGIIVPVTGYRLMFLCLALVCLINLGYFHFYLTKKARAMNAGVRVTA